MESSAMSAYLTVFIVRYYRVHTQKVIADLVNLCMSVAELSGNIKRNTLSSVRNECLD